MVERVVDRGFLMRAVPGATVLGCAVIPTATTGATAATSAAIAMIRPMFPAFMAAT
jgi:hypothetical protein